MDFSTDLGTSFTREERDNLKLRGLFPAGDPLSLEVKLSNLMNLLRSKSSPIEKYIFLHTIQVNATKLVSIII